MAKKEKRLTTPELIKRTLYYISEETYKPLGNVGFVDVRIHWYQSGVPKEYWKPIQQVLVKNKLVRVGYGRAYDLELTAEAYPILSSDPFVLSNGERKPFEFTNEIKEDCDIWLCHRNWIAVRWFDFVTQWLGKKVRDNPWWQLIITGILVGIFVVVAGEYIKRLLFPSNC